MPGFLRIRPLVLTPSHYMSRSSHGPLGRTRWSLIAAIAAKLLLDTQAHAEEAAPSDTALAAPTTTLPAMKVKGRRKSDDRFLNADATTQVGKTAASAHDQPFAVSVIDVERIRETGAKSLQDALLYSAGVHAGRVGFDTRGDFVAVRGMAPAIYLDGLRGEFGFNNNVRPEIYAFESLEVLKGPSSALYGQANLGGIVNAVSKSPQVATRREVELQLGSHQRKQVAMDINSALDDAGRWHYRWVALVRKANTQVDHVNDDALLLMPSLAWSPSPATRLSAQFVHQRNDSKVSSQSLPPKGSLEPAPLGPIPTHRFVGEPGWDRYDTRKSEFTLKLEQQLAPSWRWVAALRRSASQSLARHISASAAAVPDDAGNIARTVHHSARGIRALTVDARLEADLHWGPGRHQLALGLDHQNGLWTRAQHYSRSGLGQFNLYTPRYGSSPGVNLNDLPLVDPADDRVVQTGVYLADHWRWGPWIVNAAWRHDRVRNDVVHAIAAAEQEHSSAHSGRLGLMFQMEDGFAPYLSWANAFIPSLGTAAGRIRPSSGRQREAGLKYQSSDAQRSAQLAWFDIVQLNESLDNSAPEGAQERGATARGWELDLRQRLGGLELMGQLTRMTARNALTGLRLGSVAERNASVWAKYRMGNGWRMGAGLRKVGSLTGNGGSPLVPGVTLVDAMLGLDLGAWDLRLDFKNLADKTYVAWCRDPKWDCSYGERRQILLSARHLF